jgi:hypothetical protein
LDDFAVCPACREETLQDIRDKALIVQIPFKNGPRVFLSVLRGKDQFNLKCRSKDGKIATTLSEAALHLYNRAGKNWRKSVTMKSIHRRSERDRYRQINQQAQERDAPWPFSLPNTDRIAQMHIPCDK